MEVDHEKETVHCTATHRMDADLGEVIHYGGCYYAEKICGHQLKRKEVTIHASEEVKGYKCRQHGYNVGCVSLLAIANFQIIDSFIQNEVINCQNGQKKCQNEEKKINSRFTLNGRASTVTDDSMARNIIPYVGMISGWKILLTVFASLSPISSLCVCSLIGDFIFVFFCLQELY